MGFEVGQQNNVISDSPLAKLYRDICGAQGEYCKTELPAYLPQEQTVPFLYANKSSSTAWDRFKTGLNDIGHTILDSAYGLGEGISSYKNMFLFRNIELPVNTARAGIARALGGITSAIGVGFRTAGAIKEDFANKDFSFPQARREVILSASSIAAGGVVGAATGGLAALVGAQGGFLIGMGILGACAVGYTAHKAREYVSDFYDRDNTGINEVQKNQPPFF